MRAIALFVALLAPALAHADDTFEAKAQGAQRLHRIEGLVWALTATCDAGDDTQQRQCRHVRDARAAELQSQLLIVDADADAFDVGAWSAQKKSVPVTLSACIRCAGVELDGKTWFVTGNAAPAAFDAGKPKVATLYDNARAFNEEPASKLWTRVVANVRVELLVKVPAKPKWTAGSGANAKTGLSLDIVGYRVFTPCDGTIIAASPASGAVEADKKQCTGAIVPEPAAGNASEVEQLTAAIIDDAMQPVVEAAHDCFYHFGVAGKAKLKITVGADGAITKYEQQGDFENTTTGQCIDRAIGKAKFPHVKKPKTTILFPITLQNP
jgi:hypothetical protein